MVALESKQTNRLSAISPEKQRFYTVVSEAEPSRGRNSQGTNVNSYDSKSSCFCKAVGADGSGIQTTAQPFSKAESNQKDFSFIRRKI